MMTTRAQVKLPPKLIPVFARPRGSVDYRALYGGRGGAKSFNAAKMAAIWGYSETLRVLCVREFQASIAESFHAELKAAIASEPWLAAAYDVGKDYLRGKDNGTEFLFRGLRRNTQSIKSTAKVDLTIIEEAEDVPEDSWLALEATVMRQPKSEIWCLWNRRTKGSPVDRRFILNPPPRAIVQEVNWQDNPFFPTGLQRLRKRQLELLDDATYHHVWEGGYLENSNKQVFAGKWRTGDFTPGADWDGPYQGLDFGFNPDPLAGVRCWVHNDRLYIEHEAYRQNVEIDEMAEFVGCKIPGFAEYTARADSAEPKTISYGKRNGLPRLEPVAKWPNSVLEGIRFMRSFREIIVHERCTNTATEFRLYSHATNKAGDVLPDVVDAYNHSIDAIRYALAPLIKGTVPAAMFLTTRGRR